MNARAKMSHLVHVVHRNHHVNTGQTYVPTRIELPKEEEKGAIRLCRKLPCRTFKDNQTRWHLFALDYNLANVLRRLALPRDVKHWSLTTLRGPITELESREFR